MRPLNCDLLTLFAGPCFVTQPVFDFAIQEFRLDYWLVSLNLHQGHFSCAGFVLQPDTNSVISAPITGFYSDT